MLERYLHKVYEGFDVSHEVEVEAWREVLRIINEGSVEGLIESRHEHHEEAFLRKLRHSNEVFAAFKCHSMGSKMQERLHDGEGKLRSFDEWVRSVASITSHHTVSWLRTEYDTAILRAHQAADWQEFVRNRDVLPNLRWMPTTSPSPEAVHESFWTSGLTLPVDDPFWATNHPANRWNCKCSLEATDAPSKAWSEPHDPPKAQPGLEENPRHGRTFSDKHPYFPKDCSACPFYKPKGVKGRLQRVLVGRVKDCHSCPYVDKAIMIAQLEEKYPLDKWEHSYISESSGYVITERARIAEGRRNSRERGIFAKEMAMSKFAADNGHHIIYLRGTDRPPKETYDIYFDGIPADLKSFSGTGAMIKQIKHALEEQGAKMVIVRLESEKPELMEMLLEARRKIEARILYYVEGRDKVLRELK